MKNTTFMLIGTIALAVTTPAAEIAYKNNAYQWSDGSWEGGV